MKWTFIIILSIVLIFSTPLSSGVTYTQDYNNFLSRSIADDIYCLLTLGCGLSGNLTSVQAPYLFIFNNDTIGFNETVLNATIDARVSISDTRWDIITSKYLDNFTDILDVNETTLNNSILTLVNNSPLNLTNLFVVNNLTVANQLTAEHIVILGVHDEISFLLTQPDIQTQDMFVLETANGTDLFTVHSDGEIDIFHEASDDNDITMHIECIANGFAGLKCLQIDFHLGALETGQFEAVFQINLDDGESTGGELFAILVEESGNGSSVRHALVVGTHVEPILQFAGDFDFPDAAFRTNSTFGDFVNISANISSTINNVTLFSENEEYIVFGHNTKFSEIEILLDTDASGGGIKPVFEYSNGTDNWLSFSPIDGTDGFRDNGIILFESDTLIDFNTATVNGTPSKFWIRIQRTRNSLSTAPIELLIEISDPVEYFWNETGEIFAKNICDENGCIGFNNTDTNDTTQVINLSLLIFNLTRSITNLNISLEHLNLSFTNLSIRQSSDNSTQATILTTKLENATIANLSTIFTTGDINGSNVLCDGFGNCLNTIIDTVTRWSIDNIYLNNVSDTLTFNESLLNITIRALDTNDTNQIIWENTTTQIVPKNDFRAKDLNVTHNLIIDGNVSMKNDTFHNFGVMSISFNTSCNCLRIR